MSKFGQTKVIVLGGPKRKKMDSVAGVVIGFGKKTRVKNVV